MAEARPAAERRRLFLTHVLAPSAAFLAIVVALAARNADVALARECCGKPTGSDDRAR